MKHGYSTRYDSTANLLSLVRTSDNVIVASVPKDLAATDRVQIDTRGSTIYVKVNGMQAIIYSEPQE